MLASVLRLLAEELREDLVFSRIGDLLRTPGDRERDLRHVLRLLDDILPLLDFVRGV